VAEVYGSFSVLWIRDEPSAADRGAVLKVGRGAIDGASRGYGYSAVFQR